MLLRALRKEIGGENLGSKSSPKNEKLSLKIKNQSSLNR